MSDLIRILLVIAIIVYVIGRQLAGEPLRAKRVVILPLIVTIIGVVDVSHSTGAVGGADVALLAVGVVVSAAIGVALGAAVRLENRDGYLWGRLPVRALWLWVGLVVARVALVAVADGVHAHLAASGSTILLTLGVNRLSQAAVVLIRAMNAGVPFAPEKDGRSLLTGLTGSAGSTGVTGSVGPDGPTDAGVAVDGRPGLERTPVDWARVAGQAQTYLQSSRRGQDRQERRDRRDQRRGRR